jgi:outer membrane protein assembly factor BamB
MIQFLAQRYLGFERLVTLALFGMSVPSAFADADWPGWRGPAANGSVTQGSYPTHLGATNLLWKFALPGKGSSTPIVWKERIYVTTPADGQDAVLALDLNGQELWRTKLGPESTAKHRTLGSSCNASPVTDGQRIYVYFRSGTFAAVEFDGSVRWETNLVQKFGREQLFWDQGTSPMVTDAHVVMARLHGGDSWIAGFDKATGDLRWQERRNYKVPSENDNGYTTPILFDDNGRKALLVWGADHLTAHSAADGKLLWSCDGFNPDGIQNWPAIAMPLVVGKLAIVPVGRDDRKQARLYAIKLGGHGDVTDTHRAWKREDTGVFVTSPAASEGRMYLVRHRGDLACLDAATGQTVWTDALPRDKASYFSSPVVANGLLYAAREDGVVFVSRVGDKCELLSENPMGERIVASPALAGGRLLLRGDQHLFCFGRK